jgi:bacteriocin-like protein
VTGITIKEGAMNTNSSGNSCELTDDELDAVNGGALDGYYMSFGCVSGRVSPEDSAFVTSDRHGFPPPTR